MPDLPANFDDSIDWSLCTWEGSRLSQHREYYALPFRRKLEINEEMADFALRMLDTESARAFPTWTHTPPK
ncbi:MAG: hypothetical protein WBL40_13775 [Terrimicrobiaceae bacterium]